MIGTILLVLLALATVVVFVAAKAMPKTVKKPNEYYSYGRDEERTIESKNEARRGGFILAGGLGFFTVLTLFWTMTAIVPAGHVAVPVTFGNVGDGVGSGFKVKAPWTDFEYLPTRPFSVDDQTVRVRTSQSGQYDVRIGGRWNVVPANAKETFLQVRTGDEQKISDIVERAIATATNDVYVKLDNQQAATERENVRNSILNETNAQMSKFGVLVTDIFVRSSEPDAQTANANARLAAQRQETNIAQEAINTADKQAQANVKQAAGLKNAAAQLPSNLSPEQVAALCAQAWERQVSAATKANVPLYTTPCGSGNTQVLAGAK